jgi:hypothetical protein
MADSTIPAVQAAILTILQAHAPLAGVAIRPIALTENEDMPPNGEIVYLGDVEIPEENWQYIGRGNRLEDYWISLVVWVQAQGDETTLTSIRARAHAIWSDVSDALRADIVSPSSLLRGAGALKFDGFRGRDSAAPVAPQTWACRIDRQVNFEARI